MPKKKAVKKQEVKQLRFLKSPTGTYNLAYSAGNVIPANTLGTTKCNELIEAGYAEYVN